MLRITVTLATLFLVVSTAHADVKTLSDAQAQLATRDYGPAEAILSSVTEREPENAQAWFLLGYARHAMGDIEGAIPCHERAAQAPKTRAGALYNLACAHALLDRHDEAFQALQRAMTAGLKNTQGVRSDEDLRNLHADPRFQKLLPDPAEAEIDADPRAFDFWIGDWTAAVRRKTQGAWKQSGQLQSRVFSVLGGRAIVEYSEGIGANTMLGFSARCFDPTTQRWTALLNWPSQNNSVFSTMDGRVHHGRAEFLAGGGPSLLRYTFSDIGPTRYRWDQASSKDAGTTWNTTMMFLGTRAAADAAPLSIGPSRSHSRCSAPPYRALDFLEGTWQGSRTADKVTQAVRARFQSVMEGSAMECSLSWGPTQSSNELYAITALDQRVNKWVWYQLDTHRPRFMRLEGKADPGAIVLRGRRDARPHRLRIQTKGERLLLSTETSADGGHTWTPLSTDDLGRE